MTSGCLRASYTFSKAPGPKPSSKQNALELQQVQRLLMSYDILRPIPLFSAKCQLGLKEPIVLSPATETVVCVGFVAVKELLIEPVKESVY